jgi:hypothetical protein
LLYERVCTRVYIHIYIYIYIYALSLCSGYLSFSGNFHNQPRGHHYSNLKLFKSETIQIWNYSNLKLFKSETIQIWNYSNLELFKSETIQMWNYSNMKLFKSETIQIWNYSNLNSVMRGLLINLPLTRRRSLRACTHEFMWAFMYCCQLLDGKVKCIVMSRRNGQMYYYYWMEWSNVSSSLDGMVKCIIIFWTEWSNLF